MVTLTSQISLTNADLSLTWAYHEGVEKLIYKLLLILDKNGK